MAKVRIEVGALSTEKTTTDANAGETLKQFALATGAPLGGTNQQYLDWALARTVEYWVRVGRQKVQADAAEAALATAESTVNF
jgi:hypothetical protein